MQNPEANNLEKMSKDVYNLKIGSEIYSVDYDHDTGKFTQEEKIVSKNNVILCGLHTLYSKKTNDIIDLKIFIDTDRELIKKWKIKRGIYRRKRIEKWNFWKWGFLYFFIWIQFTNDFH